MSFFGFDTSMPQTLSLEEKLDYLKSTAGDDIEVYDFGGDGYDNLGDALEETGDDDNDLTFGGGPVGKDFDFAGSTSQFAGEEARNSRVDPVPSADQPSGLPPGWLDVDPLLGGRPLPRQQQHQTQQQQPPSDSFQFGRPQPRTVEELEAEMRAANLASSPNYHAQPQQQQQQRPQVVPMTVEELEAQWLSQARAAQSRDAQPARALPPSRSLPVNEFELFQQHARQQEAQLRQQQSASPFAAGQVQQLFAEQQARQSPFPHQQHLHHHQQQQQQQQQQQPGLPFTPPPSELPLQRQLHQQHQPHPSLAGAPLPPHVLPGIAAPMAPRHHVDLSQPQIQGIILANGLTRFPPVVQQQIIAQHQRSVSESAIPPVTAIQPGLEALGPIQQVNPAIIREHEKAELKRNIKARKITAMAKYNNLMSQSDKDFITRIQVSQIVSQNPFNDDFYFHMYATFYANRLATGRFERVAIGRPGPGGRQGERRLTRRENAMVKMAQQVQRIVDNSAKRPKMTQLSLDGALGSIALRSKAGPRQMLQVKSESTRSLSELAKEKKDPAAVPSHHAPELALPSASGHQGAEKLPPMTRKEALIALEEIYDLVLDLDQLRRQQPPFVPPEAPQEIRQEAEQAHQAWRADYAAKVEELWEALRLPVPLEVSNPHPFISLMSIAKGKRLIPRVIRHISPEQQLTLVTLLIACFQSLDVVHYAPVLDGADDLNLSRPDLAGVRRSDVLKETDIFTGAFVPLLDIISNMSLRLVAGLTGVLMQKNDVARIAISSPGLVLLTSLIGRAVSLKQLATDQQPGAPDESEVLSWSSMFDALFHHLCPHLMTFFPSTRAIALMPFGAGYYLNDPSAGKGVRPEIDQDDQVVWRFLAIVAAASNMEQQSQLVTAVREKVLENVTSATKRWVAPDVAKLKIDNVNLMLNALGLDSTMIQVEE